MLRGLHLPPHLDVTNEEQLATYARNVWRGVNPGGEASSSGVRRDPQPEAIPTGAPPNQEEEVPRPAFLQPLPEEPMAEDSISPSTVPEEESGVGGEDLLQEGLNLPAMNTENVEGEREVDEEVQGAEELHPGEDQRDDVLRGDPGGGGGRDEGPPSPPGPPDEEPQGDPPLEGENPVPTYRVWITPMGTRYHTSLACPTLAASRRLFESRWCRRCGRVSPSQRYGDLCIPRPGADAHVDLQCPLALGPWNPYPHCQRCSTA